MSQSDDIRVCEVVSGDLWAGAEVMAGILIPRLHRIPGIAVKTVLFNNGVLARRLKESGVSVEILDESTLGLFNLIRRMKALLRVFRPHVIHSHGYKEHIVAAIASPKAVHVRTLHGLAEPHGALAGLKMRMYHAVENRIIKRKTKYLVCVSKESMDRVRHTGRAEKTLIYNGIDLDGMPEKPDRTLVRRELKISKGIPLIGAVGRLVPVKDFDSLITAALILGGKDKRLRVVIVGDGPERMSLQKRRDELGLSNRVTFLGHRNDVHHVISGLDLLVMPSRHEGLPMTLLEAMALRVPVVASRVGGIVEVLGDMTDRLTVSPGDPASLAEKCWDVLTNRELMEECIDKGAARITEVFTAEKMAESYADLIRRAVGRT